VPCTVSQHDGALGGTDAIGEQHRLQHAFNLALGPPPGKKFLDFVDKRVLVAGPEQMIFALQCSEAGARDPTGQIFALGELDIAASLR
jgi:hypothetical protein